MAVVTVWTEPADPSGPSCHWFAGTIEWFLDGTPIDTDHVIYWDYHEWSDTDTFAFDHHWKDVHNSGRRLEHGQRRKALGLPVGCCYTH